MNIDYVANMFARHGIPLIKDKDSDYGFKPHYQALGIEYVECNDSLVLLKLKEQFSKVLPERLEGLEKVLMPKNFKLLIQNNGPNPDGNPKTIKEYFNSK
jgi:hypothetical protein